MIAFGDSSALVKLYADESDADVVRAVPTFVASQLCQVEVPAALWRKHRQGSLTVEDVGVLSSAFEFDCAGDDEEPARILIVALDQEMVRVAARLCASHPLRAHDAVQLATALAARELDPAVSTFAAFDTTLRRAAVAEGLTLLPAR